MKVYRDAFINNDIESAAATSVILAFGTLLLSIVMLRVLNAKSIGEDNS